MKTTAIYARYSTDLQNERSISDQLHVCRERAQREAWKVFDCYTDYALSGANMRRPGLQQMMRDAREGCFNIILVEALDRLSRDQADIATIYKRLDFHGVEIITLSEGRVGTRDVALLGMMNQHYRVENANKVRRGLIGRIMDGKAPGNISYGYRVVRQRDGSGEPIRGGRRIEKKHASIIRRIFRNYAEGQSPKKIAHRLNQEGVAGPRGREWNPSTISGDRFRGIGVLNNELYAGVRVWNRVTFVHDPETGKRVSRFNPPELWIRKDVPSLRIIDQRLWDRVKRRQHKTRRPESLGGAKFRKRRRKHLLSGIVRCGLCGGRYVPVRHNRLGCAIHNDRGTCKNGLRISRATLEAEVLGTLKDRLGRDPRLCVAVCAMYARRLIDMEAQREAKIDLYRDELSRIEVQREQAQQAIRKRQHARAGVTAELLELNRRHQVLAHEVARAVTSRPDAGVLKTYRDHVDELVQTFSRDTQRAETFETLRALIGSVVLRPNKDRKSLFVEIEKDPPIISSPPPSKKLGRQQLKATDLGGR
jgi:DNA invertase Pin-like site-specific DNA recombinase